MQKVFADKEVIELLSETQSLSGNELKAPVEVEKAPQEPRVAKKAPSGFHRLLQNRHESN